jgi:hypothetical protein
MGEAFPARQLAMLTIDPRRDEGKRKREDQARGMIPSRDGLG